MPETIASRATPLVLLVSSQEWWSRSLETILASVGYVTVRAYTGARGLERAREGRPDVILLDAMLPDGDGLDFCRQLRLDSLIPASTPILIVSPEPPTRQRRIAALRAGAWDHWGQPLDAEEFRRRIEALARAKLDADEARAQGLIDQETGLYNMRGLARRAQELGAQAARAHASLACVVLAPEFAAGGPHAPSVATLHQVVGTLKAHGRASDVIGRLNSGEFAVLAIGAGVRGAVSLANRLADAIRAAQPADGVPRFEVRAGYYSVPDFHSARVDAAEAVLRAASALQLARAQPQGGWLRQFDPAVSSGRAVQDPPN